MEAHRSVSNSVSLDKTVPARKTDAVGLWERGQRLLGARIARTAHPLSGSVGAGRVTLLPELLNARRRVAGRPNLVVEDLSTVTVAIVPLDDVQHTPAARFERFDVANALSDLEKTM